MWNIGSFDSSSKFNLKARLESFDFGNVRNLSLSLFNHHSMRLSANALNMGNISQRGKSTIEVDTVPKNCFNMVDRSGMQVFRTID